MKLTSYFLLGLALILPQCCFAQDGETVAANLANFWARKAREHRFIKDRHRAIRMRQMAQRPRINIPPWIAYKKGDEKDADSNTDAEAPNAEGKKILLMEDLQLWSAIDLNKDGKLTVSEYERFVNSPSAQAFVRQMKANKAVQAWATKIGMDVQKARAAMMVGANAVRREQILSQNYYARLRAQQRQAELARRNQQILAARQRQQSYWARLGVNPYMQQQYYQAMKQRGGRTEL